MIYIAIDIELYGINHNPDQDEWSNSPKAYANVYIDDAAMDVLWFFFNRPCVIWEVVGKHIVKLLKENEVE